MPIRPENRRHYTAAAGWPALRKRVLVRCRDVNGIERCELCGVENRMRYRRGRIHAAIAEPDLIDSGDGVVIVLTIAHLNNDPTDNRLCNLRALCQRCHNVLDAPWRTRNAARTRAARLTTRKSQPCLTTP